VAVQGSNDSAPLALVYLPVSRILLHNLIFTIEYEYDLHIETDQLSHGQSDTVESLVVNQMRGSETDQCNVYLSSAALNLRFLFYILGEGRCGSGGLGREVQLTEVDTRPLELPLLFRLLGIM
jgi:hypothetical protein